MMTNKLTQKAQVLFVDDDKNLQRAQKRMLRPVRNEWDMTFVPSGSDAIDHLNREGVDVVITDMRMPEMNGAELLDQVTKFHPEVMRIVLSGFGEKDSIARTLATSHQFLDKPCEAALLIDNIRRLLGVRDSLSNEKLRGMATSIAMLPSLPMTHRRFIQELENEAVTPEAITEIIELDIALSAKILKLANSAYFSPSSRITCCLQAVKLLGTDILRRLSKQSSLFTECDIKEGTIENIGQLNCHSLRVGRMASRIMEAEGFEQDVQNDALVAGFLAQIGRLLLCNNDPDGFKAALTIAKMQSVPLYEAECQIFGATHSELSAYILRLWGFSDAIVEAVGQYQTLNRLEEEHFGIMVAVHVAQVLSQDANSGWLNLEVSGEEIDSNYLRAIGKLDRLSYWESISRNLLH